MSINSIRGAKDLDLTKVEVNGISPRVKALLKKNPALFRQRLKGKARMKPTLKPLIKMNRV